MIIIYINDMTIAILIHKSVNCKCESMKSVNKDDEGRGGGDTLLSLRGSALSDRGNLKREIATLRFTALAMTDKRL